MSDAEVPSSKKRVAGRQISKDCPESDDDAPEAEMGTFQKASEEVMAKRRIVKVPRNNAPSSAPFTNPFAAICLVPPEDRSAKTSYPAEQTQTVEATTLNQNDKTENTESPSWNKTGINESEYVVEIEDEGSKVENVPQESLDKADDANDKGQNDGEDIDSKALNDTKKKDGETQKEAGEETTNEAGKANTKEENINDEKDLAPPTESVSSFGQLSGSKNAFASLSGGSGFSTSSNKSDFEKKRYEILEELLHREKLKTPVIYSLDDCWRKLQTQRPNLLPEVRLAVLESFKDEKEISTFMLCDDAMVDGWIAKRVADYYRVPMPVPAIIQMQGLERPNFAALSSAATPGPFNFSSSFGHLFTPQVTSTTSSPNFAPFAMTTYMHNTTHVRAENVSSAIPSHPFIPPRSST